MKASSVVSGLALASAVSPVTAITETDVESVFNQLQTWYNESTGLWIPSTGWWNSANCLTTIADLARIDDNILSEAESIFSTTFTNAQNYNMEMTKVVGANALIQVYYGNHWPYFPPEVAKPEAASTGGFLDGYYDDEGWWALAWIAAYDVTGDTTYLNMAETIFANMVQAYGTTPCNGGIWWDKKHTYVNAIANELFLDVAAHLANRCGSDSSYYLNWAVEEWNWFSKSGMINSHNLINDGLTGDCENNGETIWSYNQGVILGGLTELAKAANDSSYITEAKLIADAAIAKLTDSNGILHDVCEPDHCGADGSQFKGVFMRNLKILQRHSPESSYTTFLENNAESILSNDNEDNSLSLIWSGSFMNPANASTQSSAMDALVALLAFS